MSTGSRGTELCGFSWFRALCLWEPLDTWLRAQKVDYKHPIEIHHWNYMEALLPMLALFRRTSKYLEADEYPTGSKVLKKLWRLRDRKSVV